MTKWNVLSKWLHHHRPWFLLASVFVVMGEFGWSVPSRIGLVGISSIWWTWIVEWGLWRQDFNWKPCHLWTSPWMTASRPKVTAQKMQWHLPRLKLQKTGVPNRLSIGSGEIVPMPTWHIYRRWDTRNRHRSRHDGPPKSSEVSPPFSSNAVTG